MAHRYREPIQVTTATTNLPECFVWHGAHYHIAEVLASWHLRDRWWERPAASAAASAAGAGSLPSDRVYYRVRCRDQQTFDLYYDAAQTRWVLDCVHD